MTSVSVLAGPRVTVAIPVFNSEQTLERCVRSAMGQTMRDLEILIADDDPQILRALRITLTARGYEVVTAPDWRSGLRRRTRASRCCACHPTAASPGR